MWSGEMRNGCLTAGVILAAALWAGSGRTVANDMPPVQSPQASSEVSAAAAAPVASRQLSPADIDALIPVPEPANVSPPTIADLGVPAVAIAAPSVPMPPVPEKQQSAEQPAADIVTSSISNDAAIMRAMRLTWPVGRA